jgi:hypothetical protein
LGMDGRIKGKAQEEHSTQLTSKPSGRVITTSLPAVHRRWSDCLF